ncbi:MAG: hypothetical protein RBS56_04510 [Candidatus Gracilibacteria bacterium]|jgi:hypothetical protein|nr:hypothetical protein [Candidatus Gracilibacteria bacterium]
MSKDGITRKPEIPDFVDGLHLEWFDPKDINTQEAALHLEWFDPKDINTQEAALRHTVAKITESMVSEALGDDTIKRKIQSFFDEINENPEDKALITEAIKNLIRKDLLSNIASTIQVLFNDKKFDTNTILEIAVPVAISVLKIALTHGYIIQDFSESIKIHMEKQQPLSQSQVREANYLRENIQDFILQAHHEKKPFSMLAVKFDDLKIKGFTSIESRLLSFMNMVINRENFDPNEKIEIVAKEKGYYIIVFINVEAKTACLLAWNLDTELKRCFDEKFHLAVSSFNPTLFEEQGESLYKKIEQSSVVPILYALTLLRILDQGLIISKESPTAEQKIVVQGKLFLAKEAISLHVDSHIVEQMRYFNDELTNIFKTHYAPQIERRSALGIKSQPLVADEEQRPSSIRQVHFPEDRVLAPEAGKIVEIREVPFKGLRSDDEK